MRILQHLLDSLFGTLFFEAIEAYILEVPGENGVTEE